MLTQFLAQLSSIPLEFTGGLVVGLVLGIAAKFAVRALAAVAVLLVVVELVARSGALAAL